MGERDARLTPVLRTVVWAAAAIAMLIPLAARLWAGLPWTPFDFMVWGAMLLIGAGVCEIGLRLSGSLAYRAGVVVAAGTAFLITWSNLAVGIIGEPEEPVNLVFFGVLAIAAAGACVARFRARGMAVTMAATAAVQFATAFVALAYEQIVFAIVGVFAMGWLLAAWLFREAARGEARVD